ncbi:MAG: hypothetical protein QM820_44200 [Minicystis sp.]
MKTSILGTSLFLSAIALSACSGPPVPSPIEDEEICGDYESTSGEKMAGGMRVPVQLSVLAGRKPVFATTLRGLRDPKAPKTQIMLPDADAEYTVEWAQCATPQPARKLKEGPDPAYQCGAAKVYKTEKLVTKKGDEKSRSVRFALPPDATCMIGALPPTPGSGPSAAPSGSAAPDAKGK